MLTNRIVQVHTYRHEAKPPRFIMQKEPGDFIPYLLQHNLQEDRIKSIGYGEHLMPESWRIV